MDNLNLSSNRRDVADINPLVIIKIDATKLTAELKEGFPNTPNGLSVVCQDAHLLAFLDHDGNLYGYSNHPVLQGVRTPIYKLYPVIIGDLHHSLIQIIIGGEEL